MSKATGNLLAATIAAAFLGALAAGMPQASTGRSVTSFLNSAGGQCPTYPGHLEICSGQVPSFDGSELDVDLTKPLHERGGRHPLIVMLHGFANDKHEWESVTNAGNGADKWHWTSNCV